MLSTLILWGHALAALLFGGLAVWTARGPKAGMPRRALTVALWFTAVWALAVAGVGPSDLVTRLMEGLRNIAWLAFLLLLHRRIGPARASAMVYGVVIAVVLATMMLHLILTATGDPDLRDKIESASLLFRMMVAIAALMLIHNLYAAGGAGHRALLIAVAAVWLVDLNVLGIRYLTDQWPLQLVAMRGLAMALIAVAIGTGLQRRNDWTMQLSRTVAYQILTLAAIALYFVMLAGATRALESVGGDHARVLQTAFVFGSTAAILTLLSSPWLRAWAKVKLAKHFFRHRYDYRAEWMRFTETLGQPEGAAPLDERIVKAIADLTDSPAGLLLVPEGNGLGLGARWNWDGAELPDVPTDESLARLLETGGRIVEIDDPDADLPRWIRDLPQAWVLVPLPHLNRLAGAILLARPPLQRALDWEDFDLLRVAGRQVASYLAEARAHAALAEAQRFDEFNRRFAFIMHDIKNLVSQLTLVAHNAERHADNPAFRADMVATLQDSAGRMNDLLARLSQHHRGTRGETRSAVDLHAITTRIAAARRTHRVLAEGKDGILADADPAALEQLLDQLVQNAIDASPADQPVTLSVRSEGANATVDVIDFGTGMSPAFVRDKLFKPFVSSKPGGFGIGAYEAQQLAHAMGGRITVTSREGVGSCFRLTLKTPNSTIMSDAA